MYLLDIHTHHLSENPLAAIYNCSFADFLPQQEGYCSLGLHPWKLPADSSIEWDVLAEKALHPRVLAIGEAGLDKLTPTSWLLQKQVFRKQAQLSMSVQKPLIIHAVRAYNEILSLKKELSPDVPWIIHGFRGKKEMARQLTGHGFYLSFGEYYHPDALTATPIGRLFLETDESNTAILDLYERAAAVLGLTVSELTGKVQANISKVFF